MAGKYINKIKTVGFSSFTISKLSDSINSYIERVGGAIVDIKFSKDDNEFHALVLYKA